MAELKAGKFTLSPQSGAAGTHQITHKLNTLHTGRNPYTRTIKASIKEDPNKYSIETLTISGAPLKITFTENEKHIAYDDTSVVFTCTTNAYALYIEHSEDAQPNFIEGIDASEVFTSNKEGNAYRLHMIDSNTGSQSEATFSIKFKLLQNTSTSSKNYNLKVYMLEEDETFIEDTVANLRIIQDSSDNSIQAYFDPSDWSEVSKNGETFLIDIFSNSTAYEVYEDVAWIDISPSSPTGDGDSYNAKLSITVSPQKVASLKREGTIYIKSTITGSILDSFIVSQEAGDPYNISWSTNSISFEPTDFSKGTTKTNTLTANSNWDITEPV